jgi:hypothetical protein
MTHQRPVCAAPPGYPINEMAILWELSRPIEEMPQSGKPSPLGQHGQDLHSAGVIEASQQA